MILKLKANCNQTICWKDKGGKCSHYYWESDVVEAVKKLRQEVWNLHPDEEDNEKYRWGHARGINDAIAMIDTFFGETK